MPNFSITVPASNTTGTGESRRITDFSGAMSSESGVFVARTPDVSYAAFEVAPGPLFTLSSAAPVNQAPVVGTISVTMNENETNTVFVLDFVTDNENDPITIAIENVTQGTAVLNADQSISFTPPLNASGEMTLTYSASDEINPPVSANIIFDVLAAPVQATGNVEFGALTPAGQGGILIGSTTITGGNAAGHFELVSGRLRVSAAGAGNLTGTYNFTFGNGTTLALDIIPNKRSARVEELAAAWSEIPLTIAGVLIQDGDARVLGRLRLPPKAFTTGCVLEPTNWVENADPRLSVRPVTLGGLTIGGDPSGDAILRMENLTVQGFVFQLETGGGEDEFNNGIILVERPSLHSTIRQNEVWSRRTEEIVMAGDYSNGLNTCRQMRGIATKVYNGLNQHIRIEDNWVHDVTRGVIMTGTSHFEGVRSRLCGNYIEDCYTNFYTCGYLDGLDIFDNRCMGMYAAQGDTTGPIPSSSPHSSVGGSFDAGGSRSTQNITMMGNLQHIGWKRTKLHADLGLPAPNIGATGIKFNDPTATDSYWNIVVAFNTVVAHGICMEMTGAGADTFIDVFNNSLIYESYTGDTKTPSYYFMGAQNVRIFNNLGPGYTFGGQDGSGIFVKTTDTMVGYGNIKTTNSGAVGTSDPYFVGHSTKGFDELTIDEALAAYVPIATQAALTAPQKKGALGTGLYSGNGVHTVVYDNLDAQGTAFVPTRTVWNGTNLGVFPALNRSGTAQGSFTKLSVFFDQIRFDASQDNSTVYLYGAQFNRMLVQRTFDKKFEVYVKDTGNNTVFSTESLWTVDSSDGFVSIFVSFDIATGEVHMLKFDETSAMPSGSGSRSGVASFSGSSGIRLGTDYNNNSTSRRFVGVLGQVLMEYDYVPLDTQIGLNKVVAVGGAADWGVDGSNVFPAGAAFVIRGTAGNMVNGGYGGTISTGGGLQDFVSGAPTLTNAAVTTGATTATLTFSTNESGGTVTGTAVPTSGATITTPAQTVTAIGSQSVGFTGLQSGRQYTFSAVHTDVDGNASNPASATATTSSSTSFSPSAMILSTTLSTALNNSSVAYASNIPAGRLLIGEATAELAAGTHTFNTPPGWTSIRQASQATGSRKTHLLTRISDGTETGNVSFISAGSFNLHSISVYDVGPGLSTATLLEAKSGVGQGAASAINLTVISGTATIPAAVIAFYGHMGNASDITSRPFTGMAAETDHLLFTNAANRLYTKARLIKAGDTPADITASIATGTSTYKFASLLVLNLS